MLKLRPIILFLFCIFSLLGCKKERPEKWGLDSFVGTWEWYHTGCAEPGWGEYAWTNSNQAIEIREKGKVLFYLDDIVRKRCRIVRISKHSNGFWDLELSKKPYHLFVKHNGVGEHINESELYILNFPYSSEDDEVPVLCENSHYYYYFKNIFKKKEE